MAKRRQIKSVDWLIDQIDKQLKKLGEYRSEWNLREKVIQLTKIYEHIKDLGVNAVIEHGLDPKSALERIRLYFIEYVGIVIEGAEIQVVSGISEYARRIRQLRKENGYQIASGASNDPKVGIDLKPDQYLLVSKEPDQDAARRWHVANRIRRSGGGAQQKILKYLLENVNKIVTTEELAYVSKDKKQFARRIRELRTQHGYLIATHFTGRPDLKIGQYILLSSEPIAKPRDRQIPESVQQAVYKRDKSTCIVCGWNDDKWSLKDPRYMELHHLEHHEKGGTNEESNLIIICNKCHDEVHAGKHQQEIKKIRESICRMYSQNKKEGK